MVLADVGVQCLSSDMFLGKGEGYLFAKSGHVRGREAKLEAEAQVVGEHTNENLKYRPGGMKGASQHANPTFECYPAV